MYLRITNKTAEHSDAFHGLCQTRFKSCYQRTFLLMSPTGAFFAQLLCPKDFTPQDGPARYEGGVFAACVFNSPAPSTITTDELALIRLWLFLLPGEYLANPGKRSPVWKQPSYKILTVRGAMRPALYVNEDYLLSFCWLCANHQNSLSKTTETPSASRRFFSLRAGGRTVLWLAQRLGCQHVWVLFLVVTDFSCDFGRVT